MIQEGDRPADFTLTDGAGNPVRSGDWRGKPVVVFFYPKADTPGCTTEACDFRDHAKDFAARGVTVVGISADKPAAQSKFGAKYGLTMPLLSDTEHAVLKPWGVFGPKKNYGKVYDGIIRTTVLLDKDGIVRKVWSPVTVKGHVDAVLAELDRRGS